MEAAAALDTMRVMKLITEVTQARYRVEPIQSPSSVRVFRLL